MILRYQNEKIQKIFSDEQKLQGWQTLELALIRAEVNLGGVEEINYLKIKEIWEETPIDISWWKKRDEEIHHDLNAFLDERLRILPKYLHVYVHGNITSYDTEEAPSALSLLKAIEIVDGKFKELQDVLIKLALEHRYTLMMSRTHGQEAELQTFGARILTWIQDLRMSKNKIDFCVKDLSLSKLSGAIGKYGAIDPKIEEETLKILGLEPYYGATQIMPRVIYAPLAQNLSNMVSVMDKIANDIRLSARSGQNVLMREPFAKKQKGSSAMPHKKNTIQLEQIEGMAIMARGLSCSISETIKTWEERSIEQSCVERVCWPDLFHVVIRVLETLKKVLTGINVYKEKMLEEIVNTRGIYAAAEIKEWLKQKLIPLGLNYEDVYRIVQIASFNAFEVDTERLLIRNTKTNSIEDAETLLKTCEGFKPEKNISIKTIISCSMLIYTDELDITKEKTAIYNQKLAKVFSLEKNLKDFEDVFSVKNLIKNQEILFEKIIGY